MKNFRIYGVSALLGATLTMGLASCSSSDPATTPEVVTPEAPKVEVNNIISGVVTSMSGEPIKDALVQMGNSKVTTGTDGAYSFEKVAVGTHNIDVDAEGKVPTTTEITIADTDNGNHILNFTLSNEGKKLVVQEDGSQKGDTETETLKGNDAAKIEVEVVAPADAVEVEEGEEQPTITITPTYNANVETETESKASTRADEGMFLIGSDITCSKIGAKLKNPLSLSYKVDQEMLNTVKAKKFVDGTWKDAEIQQTGSGSITIKVDEFATYGLFCSATMTAVAGTAEAITFSKNLWDNTNGSSEITADKADYTFKVGTDIQVQSDKVLAYLVEMIVRATGAGLHSVAGSYPLNAKLPVGTALSIAGTQAVNTFTATLGSKKVTAKQYGDVTIAIKSWAVSREHTGGGSK